MGREDIANDPRFATVAARVEHRLELEALLEPVFLSCPATEWETCLLEVEVGCVIADAKSHFAFLYSDAMRPLNVMVRAEHPSLGGAYFGAYVPLDRLLGDPELGALSCSSRTASTRGRSCASSATTTPT